MAALPFYHISIIIQGWKPLLPPFRPRIGGLRLNQWVTNMYNNYTVTLDTKTTRKPGLLILTAFLLVDGIFHKFCMIFKEK